MNIYYVYAYLRSKNTKTAKAGTPYYIGKGKDWRAFAPHPGISVPKDKSKIVFLETNLTDLGALAIERRMIRWYGRKDIGTGVLLNKTDGGEGQAGRKFSANHRKKISDANRRRGPRSTETKEKIKNALIGKSVNRKPRKLGRIQTEETKLKISLANSGTKNGMYGKVYSTEEKAKLSAKRLGVKRGPYKKRII
jgi:hypothetical protein